MSTTYFLARRVETPPVEVPRLQIPSLVLESMDGLTRIPLDNSQGFIRMPGSTGLRMAPVEVVSSRIPGVAGSVMNDVRTNERPIFIPVYVRGTDMLDFRNKLAALYKLVDPNGRRTFRLVGETSYGSRELIVAYVGGLEGADDAMAEGLTWAKFGLNLVAHEPYARAREDRVIEFYYAAGSAAPFLGVVGGTDAPWPRELSAAAVIGANMSVVVMSEVPVYPTVELVGPMSSFHGDLTAAGASTPGWVVDIPGGVGAGATMKIVTDPRRKSFRYNGALAAGRVSLGSRLSPFYPGENLLNVSAPGGGEDTIIRLSWREQFRSLW